jgi:hypothetical protein
MLTIFAVPDVELVFCRRELALVLSHSSSRPE